ncbi:MAG: flagellar hook-length control protein FliK [Nitrospinae bacterium]|nr:flagellar hook-length control protein FliK [Nitrospinota bacterium]
MGLLTGTLPTLRFGNETRVSAPEATVTDAPLDLKGVRVVGETLPAQLPPLEVGQEVSAKVMEQLPEGRLLIAVKGTLLTAVAPEGLREGMELLMRVDQLKPKVVFHILDHAQGDEAEAARILRAHLPHRVPAGQSLNVLQQELAQLADLSPQDGVAPSMAKLQALIKDLLPGDTPPNAEHIATFVRDGGLHYEAKLFQLAEDIPQALARIADRDLKGLLLQALRDLQATPARPEAQSLATSIANHLDHIETQQAANLLAQMHGEPYQLQIPFFSGLGLSTAFLSIEPDGKRGKTGRGGKGQGYHVLFRLDLEGFGETRIHAHVASKTLKVIFYVEQSDAVKLLRSELSAFRETLHALGYEEVFLEAKSLGQLSPEKRRAFEPLAVGVPTTVRLVDVRA